MKNRIFLLFLLVGFSLSAQQKVPSKVYPLSDSNSAGDMNHLAALVLEYIAGQTEIYIAGTKEDADFTLEALEREDGSLSMILSDENNPLINWTCAKPDSPDTILSFLADSTEKCKPFLGLRDMPVREIHYDDDGETSRIAQDMIKRRESLEYKNEIYAGISGTINPFTVAGETKAAEMRVYPLTLQYFRFKEGKSAGLALYFDYMQGESTVYDSLGSFDSSYSGYSMAIGTGHRIAWGRVSGVTASTFGIYQMKFDNYQYDLLTLLYQLTSGLYWDLGGGFLIGSQVMMHLTLPMNLNQGITSAEEMLYTMSGCITLGRRF